MKLHKDDILSLEKEYRRHFINSISGVKTAFLCGTISAVGQTNLSLVSSVFHVGANPPLLGMVVRPPLAPRHTLSNIMETGEYTLNILPLSHYKQGHQTAARYPKEISEFEAVGLATSFSPHIKAPYVEESSVKLGLHLLRRVDIPENLTVLIIGEIQEVIIPESLVDHEGHIDFEAVSPALVAGLDSYFQATAVNKLPYPKDR